MASEGQIVIRKLMFWAGLGGTLLANVALATVTTLIKKGQQQ